jgi:hypothetical protein
VNVSRKRIDLNDLDGQTVEVQDLDVIEDVDGLAAGVDVRYSTAFVVIPRAHDDEDEDLDDEATLERIDDETDVDDERDDDEHDEP